jgi:hypothetical protein
MLSSDVSQKFVESKGKALNHVGNERDLVRGEALGTIDTFSRVAE